MLNKAGIIKSLVVVLLIFWIGLSETTVANRPSTRGKAPKRFNVGICTHFSQDKGIIAERPRNKKLVIRMSRMLEGLRK